MEVHIDGSLDLENGQAGGQAHNDEQASTKDSDSANNSTRADTQGGSLNSGFNIDIPHDTVPDQNSGEPKQPAAKSFTEALKSGLRSSRNRVRRGISGMTKKHAFVCKPLPDTALAEYVEATTDIVDADRIIAASRMNKNIVIFLDSVEDVELVCTSGLGINGEMVFPEPMVKTSTKVIISNIPPHLPNDVLYPIIEPLGNVVSGIRPISLGMKNPKLKHVVSFRRQVYILLHPGVLDGDQLRFNIEHDNHNFTVFVSRDEVRCFQCRSLGHVRSECTYQNEKTDTQNSHHEGNIDKQITESSNVSASTSNKGASISNTDSEDFQTVSYRRKSKKDSSTTGGVRVRTPSPQSPSSKRSRSSDRPPECTSIQSQSKDDASNSTQGNASTDVEASQLGEEPIDVDDQLSVISNASCFSRLSDFESDTVTDLSWDSEFDVGKEILEAAKGKKNPIPISLGILPDPRTLLKCLKSLRKCQDLTNAQKQQLGRLLVKVMKYVKSIGAI